MEYLGYDLTSGGNCPAQSKFDLLTDWVLPNHGTPLASFIGICAFYSCFSPWFEINLKSLRLIQRTYHRKVIPSKEWTPDLIRLFDKCKKGITSSPVLARHDSDKPIFLKTDWSAEGMGYILLQPDDSIQSKAASLKLSTTGECDFDLTLKGTRLRPVCFNSRANRPYEKNYHSFVGETACGRWAIVRLKRYLWGTRFYWMCDCMAIKEILEYIGDSHQLRRWCQELMGYDFSVIHRCELMMRDVDALTRRFGKAVTLYCMQAYLMRSRDKPSRPLAYDFDHFHSTSKPQKVFPPDISLTAQHAPIDLTIPVVDPISLKPYIDLPSSVPVLHHTAMKFAPAPLASLNSSFTNCTDSFNSTFTSHKLPVWISFDTIVPAVGCAISAWPGRQSDHHVFESSVASQHIAHTAAPQASIHLLSLPELLLHLQSLSLMSPSISQSIPLLPSVSQIKTHSPSVSQFTTLSPSVSQFTTLSPSVSQFTTLSPTVSQFTTLSPTNTSDNNLSVDQPSSSLLSSVITPSVFSSPLTVVFGMDVQYLSALYPDASQWLDTVMSVFNILIASFSLQFFILSLGSTMVDSFPEHHITTLLHARFPSWGISVDSMVASEYGDNIFATRIVFRGSCCLYKLNDLVPFRDSGIRSPHLAYSDDYNSAQFSTFTTRPIHSFPSVSPASTASTSPFIFCFALPTAISQIGSDLAIVDITHPPPEPSLQPSSTLFDGWFGVPFLDTDHITHVRSPRSSEIFGLYTFPPSVV